MIAVIAAAAFFGCIAFIALQTSRAVCAGVAPAEDGPPPGKAPAIVLVVASALLGAVLMSQKTPPLQLGIAVIVVFALVACWCSDAICGIVPDLFSLVPLAAILLFALTQRDWGTFLSAGLTFVPFALAALFSRGYGMGWGDVKLAALTGAAVGGPLAIVALAAACAAAAIVNRIGGLRGPIAFAPYIAAATGVALPFGIVH